MFLSIEGKRTESSGENVRRRLYYPESDVLEPGGETCAQDSAAGCHAGSC
jgi:hypothetical protein